MAADAAKAKISATVAAKGCKRQMPRGYTGGECRTDGGGYHEGSRMKTREAATCYHGIIMKYGPKGALFYIKFVKTIRIVIWEKSGF